MKHASARQTWPRHVSAKARQLATAAKCLIEASRRLRNFDLIDALLFTFDYLLISPLISSLG